MLFQELGKLKRSMIMTSVIMIAVGILMFICPERYVSMLVVAAGYGLLIFATVMVFEYLSSKKVLINYVYLTGALLIGVLGAAVLFYREHVLQVLGLIFGIYLVAEGLNEMFNTWKYARRARRNGWWIMIVLSLLLIAAGIVILTNPWWNSPGALMKVIGGMMLLSSAVSIIHVIMIWPFKNM